MPDIGNSLYETNDAYFIRVEVPAIRAGIDQLVTLNGGTPTPTTPVPISVLAAYDSTSAGVVYLVTKSDGTVGYFTDPSGTTPIGGVVPGAFPGGGIALDAGVVDATTTRVELTTESQATTSKTGTAEWVKDTTTDALVWQEGVYDAITGLFTYTYKVAPDGAVFVPASTVEAAVVAVGDIRTVAKVDDVAGDQSGALINYVEIREIDPITGLSTLLETVSEDLSTAYVVLGTPRNGSEIGVNARTAPFSELLPVGDWVPSLLTESFAYAVFTVGDTLMPPTFTDTDSVTTSLFQGETANFQLSGNTEALNTTNLKITVNTGDVVKVYGVKYSA